MDSLGLRNREIRKSRCTSESMLGPVGRDPASPTSCSPPFLNWKNTSKTDSDLNHDLIREVRSGAGWRADCYARKAGKSFMAVSKKSLDLLQSYSWPGNIRGIAERD